jgi:hypothetical protein
MHTCPKGSVAKLGFRGKIRKSVIGKSTTCALQPSCFWYFVTEPSRALEVSTLLIFLSTVLLCAVEQGKIKQKQCDGICGNDTP